MAETGKYPINIRIYTYIIKYWLRLINLENNKLLKAAHTVDIENKQNGGQSWGKIIDFLLQITTMNGSRRPTNLNEIKDFSIMFKKKLTTIFEEWWINQANVTGQNKLDFYYRYKRIFKYETYLDNVEKYNRMHLTRLRLSSHNLPIEVLRYNKTTRSERKCTICNLDEMGDEDHYLNKCNNRKIENIRKEFLNSIKTYNTQLENFENKTIIDYCLNMNDINIQLPTALFVQTLLKTYKTESNVPTLYNICKQYINKKRQHTNPLATVHSSSSGTLHQQTPLPAPRTPYPHQL